MILTAEWKVEKQKLSQNKVEKCATLVTDGGKCKIYMAVYMDFELDTWGVKDDVVTDEGVSIHYPKLSLFDSNYLILNDENKQYSTSELEEIILKYSDLFEEGTVELVKPILQKELDEDLKNEDNY